MIINNGNIILTSSEDQVVAKSKLLDDIIIKGIEMSRNNKYGSYKQLGKFVVDILIENKIVEECK